MNIQDSQPPDENPQQPEHEELTIPLKNQFAFTLRMSSKQVASVLGNALQHGVEAAVSALLCMKAHFITSTFLSIMFHPTDKEPQEVVCILATGPHAEMIKKVLRDNNLPVTIQNVRLESNTNQTDVTSRIIRPGS